MTRRESNPGETRLRLSGPTAVHDATLAAQAFAITSGLDEKDGSRLAILVEELVSNLYDHGELTAEDVVELSLAPAANGVSLVLTDPGKHFDPRRAAAHPPVPHRGGGAGLQLVRTWASLIDYQVSEGRNRLTMLIPGHSQGR